MIFHLFMYVYLLVSTMFLSGEDYTVSDIGTLESKSSEAIDLNNRGEILGTFNVDGSYNNTTYFFREESGRFHTIPSVPNVDIKWKFLTDSSKAYGMANKALYSWESSSLPQKIADLPSSDVISINNRGDVLLKEVSEIRNGKTIYYSAIWNQSTTPPDNLLVNLEFDPVESNVKITKCNLEFDKMASIKNLYGLGGNFGHDPKESYGLCLNNRGEVVGASHVATVYKNEISNQFVNATHWKGNQIVDLHKKLPKCTRSHAIAINDEGDIYIQSDAGNYMLYSSGELHLLPYSFDKLNNKYAYTAHLLFDLKHQTTSSIHAICQKVIKDPGSVWWTVDKIVKVNNRGEMIVQATTKHGENHAMIIKAL